VMGLRAPPALFVSAQPTSLPARILQSTSTVHCVLSIAAGTPLCYSSDRLGSHHNCDCPETVSTSDACDLAAAAPRQQIHGLEFSNTASRLEFYLTNPKDIEPGGTWTGPPTVRPRNWPHWELHFEPASSKNARLFCNTEPMAASRIF
jgi:hypothetical protein